MYNIYFNSKTNYGINFDEFKEKMIQICNDHRDSKKALVFALIIYDFESPHVSKVIHDEDYWMALNSISGDRISIFSIHKPQVTEEPVMLRRSMYDVYPGLGYDPKALENEIADRYFPIELTSPSIIFFQVNKEEVIETIVIKIQENLQENTFEEIKKWMQIAVESISKVDLTNKDNYQDIFNLLLQDLKSNKISKRAISRISNLAHVATFIKELYSFF